LSPFSCRLDPGYFINDIAPSERFAATASATVQLDPNHQFFLNGLYARNTFTFLGSPTSVSNRPFLQPSSPYYPHDFARAFGIDGQPLNTAWRAYELGPRTDEPIVEQWNFVAGLRGTWDGWTYDGALTVGRSSVDARYTGGYVLASEINRLLDSGVINPFGYNTPEVLSLMSKTVLHQTVRTGTSTMPAVDLRASKNVYEMSAGPLSVAVGAEARRWKLVERSSGALATGNINQVAAIPSMQASRTNWAVFAETAFPVVRTLEADIALRYDHYSDVGGTTNPKMSLRWQPDRALLLRGSVGTGFIAPGLEALYGSPVFGLTNLTSDPARCPDTRSPTDCNRTYPVQGGGNPSLQNEKSSQWGAGIVWSPLPRATLSADYFDIVANNLIASFGPQTALDLCKDGVNGPTCSFVRRGPVDPAYPTLPGPIRIINSGLFNLGTIHASGVDVSVQLATPATDWGQLSFTLQGTYIIKFDVQQTDGSYVDRVNHQVNVGGFGSIPYWHHYLTINWTYGPWSATLTQNFQKGTYDQSPSPGEAQLRKIGNYDVWNLSGSYSGLRNWVISLGIKNVLDRDPPFTNQTAIPNGGGPAGYDPTYTDPRGRLYWASVKYSSR
jgi:iron complex outermembrane receptor protein